MTAALLNSGTAAFVPGLSGQAKAGGWSAKTTDDAAIYSTSGIASGIGTIECWFKQAANPSEIQILFARAGYIWVGITASGCLQVNPFNSGFTSAELNPVCDNTWHHVAFVLDGTAFSLYLDGTQVWSLNNTDQNWDTSLPPFMVIGAITANNGTFFTCDAIIDEFAVTLVAKYRGASSAVPTTPLPSQATGQVALYHFDGDLSDSNRASVPPSVATPSSAIVGAPFQVSFTNPADGTAYLVQVQGGAEIGNRTTVAGTSGSATLTPTASGPETVRLFAAASGGGPLAESGTINVATAAPIITISPNDPGIFFSPGNWEVTDARAETINNGAYFRTLVAGSPTAISLVFDVSGQMPSDFQLAYRVDGKAWTTVAPAASIALALPAESGIWPQRLIEFTFKSSEPEVWTRSYAVRFKGIATTPGNCIAVRPQRRPLTGLVFGDSISCGVYTTKTDSTSYPDSNDATQAYSYALMETVGAEIGMCAFGGTDVNRYWAGVVPGTEQTYNVLWSGGPARDFAAIAPDFIVVNLGTNRNTDSDASYQPDYTNLLNLLLAATTTARIFAMVPFGGYHRNAIAQAVAESNAPSRVTFVDTVGWWSTADSYDAVHPWGYAGLGSLAPRLASVIRTTLVAGAANTPQVFLW